MGKCGPLWRGLFGCLLIYARIPFTTPVGPEGSAWAKIHIQNSKIHPDMEKASDEVNMEAFNQRLHHVPVRLSLPDFHPTAKGTKEGRDHNLRDVGKASKASPRRIARMFRENVVQKEEASANDNSVVHILRPTTTPALPYQYLRENSNVVLLPGSWYGSRDEERKWSLEELQAAVEKRESYLDEQRKAVDDAAFEMLSGKTILREAEPYPAVNEFARNLIIGKDLPTDKLQKNLKQGFKDLLSKKEITIKEASLWVQCFAHSSRVGQINLQKPQLEAMIQYGLLDLMAKFRPIWREDNPPRQEMYDMAASLYNTLQKRCTSAKKMENYEEIFAEAEEVPWAREIMFPEAGVGTRLNWNRRKFEEWFRKDDMLFSYFTKLNDLVTSNAEGVEDILNVLGQMGRKDNLKTSARRKTSSICLLLYVYKISGESGSAFRKIRGRVFQELVQLISKRKNSEVKAWFHDFKLIYFSLFFKNLKKVPN